MRLVSTTLARFAAAAIAVMIMSSSEEPFDAQEAPVEAFGATRSFEGVWYRTEQRGKVWVFLASGDLTVGGGSAQAGIPQPETFDTHVAVLVVKQGARFIYATVEDDDLQQVSSRGLRGDPPFDPKPDLAKKLRSFFDGMSVRI